MRRLGVKVLAVAMALTLGVSTPTIIPGGNNTTVASAAAVKISSSKLTLTVGQSKTLSLKNNKKAVTWSSSKKSVATVSSKGKVTAKKAGTATITAKVGTKKYTCKVTVKAKKAENQTCKVADLTFNVPNTVKTEIMTQDATTIMQISLEGNENEVVLVSNSNYGSDVLSYELWVETLKSKIAPLEGTEGVSNFVFEEVDTPLGKGYHVSYTATGTTTLTVDAYEMYKDGHSMEVAIMYEKADVALQLESTMDMIMKTIVLK